jgi:uncharacterized protein
MIATQSEVALSYTAAEHHAFTAAGKDFLYLVPSGAVFGLTGLAKEIFSTLLSQPMPREEIIARMLDRGFDSLEVETTLDDLEHCDVVDNGVAKEKFPSLPEPDFPLQRIVLNTTNQCNLACGYCYEYSDDKISTTVNKPKYMGEDVAQAAIDTLIRESASRPLLHVTFFGGETLLNFPLMKWSVKYAREAAAAVGKQVDFSLTTNATLLTEEIADFLAEHRIGVTVSIDGDKELNDKMRIFHNGKGSYDVIAPKIKMLLERHKTNSIGARVTLSSGVRHIRRIYEHLTKELGFKGVGISPATASPDRLYHIGGQKMDNVFDEFEELAWEYRDYALNGGMHYFTNVNDSLRSSTRASVKPTLAAQAWACSVSVHPAASLPAIASSIHLSPRWGTSWTTGLITPPAASSSKTITLVPGPIATLAGCVPPAPVVAITSLISTTARLRPQPSTSVIAFATGSIYASVSMEKSL